MEKPTNPYLGILFVDFREVEINYVYSNTDLIMVNICDMEFSYVKD